MGRLVPEVMPMFREDSIFEFEIDGYDILYIYRERAWHLDLCARVGVPPSGDTDGLTYDDTLYTFSSRPLQR